MHRFPALIERGTTLTLGALSEASSALHEELQTSGATILVKGVQAIQLQKAVLAVGMFSMFDALLQHGLACEDGFAEALKILSAQQNTELAERFRILQLAINVLKHGRGRSYRALVAKASTLPFRVKMPGEHFFHEGDVSEITTLLVQVDDAFVRCCSRVIRDVAEAISASRPDFAHG